MWQCTLAPIPICIPDLQPLLLPMRFSMWLTYVLIYNLISWYYFKTTFLRASIILVINNPEYINILIIITSKIKMTVIYLFGIRLYHSSCFYFSFASLFNSHTIIIQILHELKESQLIKQYFRYLYKKVFSTVFQFSASKFCQ